MTGRCGHRPLQIIGDNVIETVSGRLTGRETRPLQTTNRDVLSAGYIPGNILQRRNLNREFIHDVRTAKIRRVAVRPRRLNSPASEPAAARRLSYSRGEAVPKTAVHPAVDGYPPQGRRPRRLISGDSPLKRNSVDPLPEAQLVCASQNPARGCAAAAT